MFCKIIMSFICKEFVNQDRPAFAITFELILTMLLITMCTSVTLYFVRVLDIERYFSDVASSTCSMASRYGGSESLAYKVQVSQRTTGGNGVGKSNIEDNANYQLQHVNNEYKQVYGANIVVPNDSSGKFITVSDYPDANGNVTVKMSYRIAGVSWGKFISSITPATIQQEVTMPSLMQRGKLVG